MGWGRACFVTMCVVCVCVVGGREIGERSRELKSWVSVGESLCEFVST